MSEKNAKKERQFNREDVVIAAVKAKGPDGKDGIEYIINPTVGNTLLKACAFDIQDQISFYLYRKSVSNRVIAKKEGIVVPGDNGGNRLPTV